MPNSTQDSVALLKWSGVPDRVIQDTDWVFEQRDDSTNQLRAVTSLAEADGVEEEQELIFQGRRFIISGVDRDRRDGRAELIADEAQAELGGHVLTDFEFNSWTLLQMLEWALRGTRWTPGEVQPVRFGRAHFEDITVLEALHFLARHQDSVLTFDSLRRRVNITATRGTVREEVFTYGRQLTNITKESRQPVTTRIHCRGADDMTIASVNDGVPFVEDFSYYTSKGVSLADARRWFMKEDYWEDSRYTVPENMRRDALDRLAVEAHPAITYTLDAQATTAVDGTDYFDLTEIVLGDKVYVWDQEIDTRLVAEVTAVTTSSDASKNELTLAYLPESLSSSGGRGSGQYQGDSGSTVGNPLFPRSGVQPRPSMPILEHVSSVGVAQVRWNGQDHEGEYESIPVRFGSVIPRAIRLAEDGSIPSPDSEDAFDGTPIHQRGGGVSTLPLPGAGKYAVWFYMLGNDQRTRSEYSDALVVEVPEFVDTEWIEQELQDARDRLDQAQQDFQEGNDQRKQEIENLQNVVIPALEQSLNEGLSAEVTRLEGLIESAGGTTILRGTHDPTDTTDLGDGTYYFQYDTLDTGGRLQAMWVVNNGEWEKSELAEQILPLVHIEQGTYGDLHGERITANTIETSALAVNDWENLIVDSDLRELGEMAMEEVSDGYFAGQSAQWELHSMGPEKKPWDVEITNSGVAYLNANVPSDQQLINLRFDKGGVGIPAKAGDQFVISLKGEGSLSNVTIASNGFDEDGAAVSLVSLLDGDIEDEWTAEFTVLDPASPQAKPVESISFMILAGADSEGSGRWRITQFRRKTPGVLIENGAVKANNIDVNEVFADQAVIDEIWARTVRTGLLTAEEALIGDVLIKNGAVTVDKLTGLESIMTALLLAKKIEAGDIQANAIDGMTITGGVISGGRVEGSQMVGGQLQIGSRFTGSGNTGAEIGLDGTFRHYNTAGDLDTVIDGENNTFTGKFETSFGDSRLTISKDGALGRSILLFHTPGISGVIPQIGVSQGESADNLPRGGMDVSSGAVSSGGAFSRVALKPGGDFVLTQGNGVDAGVGVETQGRALFLIGRPAYNDRSIFLAGESQGVTMTGYTSYALSFTYPAPVPSGTRQAFITPSYRHSTASHRAKSGVSRQSSSGFTGVMGDTSGGATWRMHYLCIWVS